MINKAILKIKNPDNLRYYDEDVGGAFFIYHVKTNTIEHIRTCREEFSYYFTNKRNWIGFICYKLNINRLNEFFEIIENKLNLDVKTIFYPTDEKAVVIIKLSPFWLQDTCRRGFLTLFLRCGSAFYRNSFNYAIKSYNLTNDINPVIQWFLSGNTKFISKLKDYNGYSCGVVEYFGDNYNNKYNFKKELVKP